MIDVLVTYDSDNDFNVFKQIHLSLNSKYSFKISACTVAGRNSFESQQKPNEDAFSVLKLNDSMIAGVFDGTSSLKPNKLLGKQTGARFASHFVKSQLESGIEGTTTKEIIRELNKLLLKQSVQFAGASLEDTHTLPATTATIIRIDSEKDLMEASHLGDSFCVVFYKDGSSGFLTVDKNRSYDNKIFELIKKISNQKHITPREVRQDEKVKQALLDMFQDSHNKADGSGQGVINGDPNAEQYIQDISIPLKSVKAILLASDGFIPLDLDEQNGNDRTKIFNLLMKDGLNGVIKKKLETEDNDPDWNLIRYKHSDDATGVFIKIH